MPALAPNRYLGPKSPLTSMAERPMSIEKWREAYGLAHSIQKIAGGKDLWLVFRLLAATKIARP
jgi:hypothetical protein